MTDHYGAILFRMRERDFGAVQHVDGMFRCVRWPTPTSSRIAPGRSSSTRCTVCAEWTRMLGKSGAVLIGFDAPEADDPAGTGGYRWVSNSTPGHLGWQLPQLRPVHEVIIATVRVGAGHVRAAATR